MKEVIFCEDCKYRGWSYVIEMMHCEKFDGFVSKDDFCSRGEKCEGKEKETKK